MKEIIYYCDRCHRKITEEEAEASFKEAFITPRIGVVHLCTYCLSEYEALKAVHNEEMQQFMHEVFVNESK